MPSPQIIAREPSRRIKKSNKPERREEAPVDTGELDMNSAAPSQQSAKSGPGTGGGRERSRRVSERMPKAAGAKAHEKDHSAGMLDKGVGKQMTKQAKQRTAGRRADGAAAPAEAAPTQKQVLTDKPRAKRTLRNTGVDGAE